MHRASVSQLTPTELEEEFNCISNGKDVSNGKIEKDELWKFVSIEKAGHLSKKDFDSLYNAMDTDKNGSVSFLEFCFFMMLCQSEFRNAPREDKVHLLAKLISEKKVM